MEVTFSAVCIASPSLASHTCVSPLSSQYESSVGSTGCAPCAKGTYEASVGSTACDACPAGSYCHTTGLDAVTGACAMVMRASLCYRNMRENRQSGGLRVARVACTSVHVRTKSAHAFTHAHGFSLATATARRALIRRAARRRALHVRRAGTPLRWGSRAATLAGPGATRRANRPPVLCAPRAR